MHCFLKKYEVHENFVLIFNYAGNSEFELSVYDTQCMNNFCNCYDGYRFEDLMFPSCDEGVIEIFESMDVISEGIKCLIF